jgi:hypothetical protein
MYYKYPRTYHFKWSPGATSDDKILKDTKHFEGKQVVVLEKRDGENTTIYQDKSHARSIDSKDHFSRHYVKQLQGKIGHLIPDQWRICGENLQYCKSIYYDNLPDFFEVFSIWAEDNVAISWNHTLDWCDLLGLSTVPEIWRGEWDEELIKNIPLDFSKQEGYVVRLLDAFHYDDFSKSVAKMVRKGHVQTSEHWMHQQLIPNKLKAQIICPNCGSNKTKVCGNGRICGDCDEIDLGDDL